MKPLNIVFLAALAVFSVFIIVRNIIALKRGGLPKEHQKNNGKFIGLNSLKYQIAICVVILIGAPFMIYFNLYVVP